MKTRKINRKYKVNLYNITPSKVVVTEHDTKHTVDEYLRLAMHQLKSNYTDAQKTLVKKATDTTFEAYVELAETLTQHTQYSVNVQNLKKHNATIKKANKNVMGLGYVTRTQLVRLICTDEIFEKVADDVKAFHHMNEKNKLMHHTIEINVDNSDLMTKILVNALK